MAEIWTGRRLQGECRWVQPGLLFKRFRLRTWQTLSQVFAQTHGGGSDGDSNGDEAGQVESDGFEHEGNVFETNQMREQAQEDDVHLNCKLHAHEEWVNGPSR